jgi:hypothetical protein
MGFCDLWVKRYSIKRTGGKKCDFGGIKYLLEGLDLRVKKNLYYGVL